MKKKIIAAITVLFLILAVKVPAQKSDLLPDKSGTFQVVNWSVHGMSGTDYTKAETQANYKKLIGLTEILRRNQVLASPKGFDGVARLYGYQFDKKAGYGIPCALSIEFQYFFVNNKGKEVKVNIEPPSWSMVINSVLCRANTGFSYGTAKPDDTPKPGFNYEKWKEAGDKIRYMFFQPGKKETVSRGVDVYDNNYIVIYNPDNPPYWVPVTIREAYTWIIDYWKLHPNPIESEFMLKMMEDEYAQVSESERNSYAYFGANPNINGNQVAGFCTDTTKNPLVRINTEYWNKKLPRSAIQMITFDCPQDKKYLEREIESQQNYRTGDYYINSFLKVLDLAALQKIID
ncbi:MAG: hypothetical protein ACM3Q2_08535 [Syntrophothermus sp.]